MTTGLLAALAPSFEAAESVVTAIPSAFLKAFSTGGAAAATPLSTLASVAALPAALTATGMLAYDVYKTSQTNKQLADTIAKVYQEITEEEELKAQMADIKQRLDNFWVGVPEIQPVTTPKILTKVSPAAIPKVTPTVKPAPAPAPTPTPAPKIVEVTAPTPSVVIKPTIAPVTAAAPVVIQQPAPQVTVNVPEVPSPLAVTGPLTAAGLASIIPSLATSMATQSHQAGLRCMGTTGSMLLENIIKALIPAGIAAGFMFSPQLQSAITGVAQKFVEAIYSPLIAQAPITPEKGPGIGANLLAQAILFGSGAHIMSIMAEASAPLKHVGIGYLAAFMADAAGFSRIAAAYQGMMIQWGLSQPMTYWAREHFRPMIPSEGRLIDLVGEYAITREEFNQYMPYHGYPQWWIDKLFELADRAFSPMLFRFLAQAGELPEELLDRELRNARYNELSIPPLKSAFTRLAAGELQGQFAGSVTSAYRKGLLTPEPFNTHLGNLGYSQTQRSKASYAAELDFAVNLAEEMRAIYLQQHKQGQLTDSELGLQLSTLGYRPEKVNADVLKARAWFKPKPEPKPDPKIERQFREAQAKYVQGYISLFRDDYIDDKELYRRLVSVQVPPEVAAATVFMEKAKKLPKLAE